MSQKPLITSLVLLAVFSTTSCIYIPVTKQPYCIIIQEEQGKQVAFFFEAADTQTANLKVTFQPSSQKLAPFSMISSKNQTRFMDTQMKICFTSTDGSYISVSIDYYTNDVAHLAELASKSDLYDLYSKIIAVGSKIKEVNKNQIFEKQRQNIHANIINNHESNLKLLVAAKLVVIVAVALAQIFVLKKILGQSSQSLNSI